MMRSRKNIYINEFRRKYCHFTLVNLFRRRAGKTCCQCVDNLLTFEGPSQLGTDNTLFPFPRALPRPHSSNQSYIRVYILRIFSAAVSIYVLTYARLSGYTRKAMNKKKMFRKLCVAGDLRKVVQKTRTVSNYANIK